MHNPTNERHADLRPSVVVLSFRADDWMITAFEDKQRT